MSMAAIEILRTFAKNPIEMDWAPSILSLKCLLNGTNLLAFQNTLEVLTKTKISPKISKKILEKSSEIVMSYLNGKHDKTREVEIDFVMQLSGDKELKKTEDCKIWLNQFM